MRIENQSWGTVRKISLASVCCCTIRHNGGTVIYPSDGQGGHKIMYLGAYLFV
uniref:Uncharacterized protein n=1 Tax=Arion vulgaris TaxID=1028688 RepID=A0A0B7AXW1_9EUPU